MQRIFAIALLAFLAAVGQAQSQSWPAKPIRFIVPTPAGTTPDSIARLLADKLSRNLGQVVVVENITGAGGLIASRTAARAAPDGYTLYFSGTGALITDRYTQKDLGYDADRDYVLISMIYDEGSLGLAVHPDVPVKTLPDLLALAKQQPGKLSYGTTSVSLLILFGQWITKLGGVDMLAVPYKSAAQQMQDVLSGRIQIIISAPPQMLPHIRTGKLRAIAVDGSRPHPSLPGVANISETFPGFRMSGMGILAAPTGISPEIVQRLNPLMDKVVRDPDYVQTLLGMGFLINGAGTPQTIAAFLRDRRESWDKVMKGLNVQPE
ncbi:MAG: tripartite tricarboxylate transporter substrate binding protein [Betaproteobacteria bacterium]|nr:tripartite tricarboxylate transporter substrate binding protein [Betaproteobacteria bacterium]